MPVFVLFRDTPETQKLRKGIGGANVHATLLERKADGFCTILLPSGLVHDGETLRELKPLDVDAYTPTSEERERIKAYQARIKETPACFVIHADHLEFLPDLVVAVHPHSNAPFAGAA